MTEKDIKLAQLNALIHTKYSNTRMVYVPLRCIHPVHPLDRKEVTHKIEKRVKVLEENITDVKRGARLSYEELENYLPSVSPVKVVTVGYNYYVAFDGNGRIEAIKEVIDHRQPFEIEVQVYDFSNPSDHAEVESSIREIRRMHRLE